VKFEVLGCGGGIGGQDQTTCFWVDEDVLIDAGSGLSALTHAQLLKLDHVFITHSHMDHIALLPVLADSVGHVRRTALRVYALEATIKTLRDNIFNWRIWPDFTRIPPGRAPFLELVPLRVGERVDLNGRAITPIFASHVVPTVGYHLDSGAGALVFSGDTSVNDALWSYANACRNLRYLIVESAFPNRDRAIAAASMHYCPEVLVQELAKLRRDPAIYITHTKPGETQTIMRELAPSGRELKALVNRQILDF
jgi:ribonuclease BN (tRNA processing enzyme)